MESLVWVGKPCWGDIYMFRAMRSARILSSRAYLVLGFLFFFLSSSLSLLGQSATGTISGTVADSSGAVIPKATVVLTDEATKGKRDSVSNNAGIFNFPSVYPGSYTLTISADGFRTWEERKIVLTQGGNLSIPNIALQVGTAKQEIDV